MFPNIKHLNDILPFIKDKPEIGVYPSDYGTTVLCYAISDKDTFMGEHADLKRECRGITFDRDGNLICRPLHKFFNIGEKEETLPENINWQAIYRVATKHDGSMITPLMIDGELRTKTKRSFQSLEARRALEYLNNHPEKRQWVIDQLAKGITPVFEWVSPESPIVLTTYKEPELILLQAREIVSGKYLPIEFMDAPFKLAENIFKEFCNDDHELCWDSLKEKMANNVSEEGWILQDIYGNAYKAKTTWYFSVHHTCTFLRWRDMLASARDGVLDDVRAAFTYSGRDQGVIDFVERYAKMMIAARTSGVRLMADQLQELLDAGMPIAQVAAAWRKAPDFGHAMRMLRNQGYEDGIHKDVYKELLPLWSLGVIDAALLSNWNITDDEALNIAITRPLDC